MATRTAIDDRRSRYPLRSVSFLHQRHAAPSNAGFRGRRDAIAGNAGMSAVRLAAYGDDGDAV
jgi:hypothetical protein